MTTYFEEGDELKADKIIARARRVKEKKLVHHTSKDQGTQVSLVGSAYCVIDLPIRSVRERKR